MGSSCADALVDSLSEGLDWMRTEVRLRYQVFDSQLAAVAQQRPEIHLLRCPAKQKHHEVMMTMMTTNTHCEQQCCRLISSDWYHWTVRAEEPCGRTWRARADLLGRRAAACWTRCSSTTFCTALRAALLGGGSRRWWTCQETQLTVS